MMPMSGIGCTHPKFSFISKPAYRENAEICPEAISPAASKYASADIFTARTFTACGVLTLLVSAFTHDAAARFAARDVERLCGGNRFSVVATRVHQYLSRTIDVGARS